MKLDGGAMSGGRAVAAVVASAGVVTVAGVGIARFVADHHGALYDDAYIYFRYADNVLHGCGLRFGCASPAVEGFSSPLYLALLTALHALGLTLPTAATALGVAGQATATALAAWATWRWTRLALPADAPAALAGLAAVLTTTALVASPLLLTHTVTGLETTVAAAAVMAAALALGQRRWGAGTGLALAVAWWARPEAATLALCAMWTVTPGTLAAWRERGWPGAREALRRHLPWLAPLAAAVVATTAARWVLFDDVVPNTARAKAGGSAAHAALGWAYLGECAGLLPWTLVAPAALWLPGLRRATAALLAAAAAWWLSQLWTGGDHFGYARMVLPLAPALAAAASAALAGLAHRAGAAAPARWRRPAWSAATALVAATVAMALVGGASELAPAHAHANVARWQQVGRWLGQHLPGQTVATVPIGAIAWESRLEVIDLVGLTDATIARGGQPVPPALLRRAWVGHERSHPASVWRRQPAALVFTRHAATPFGDLAQARAGFYAEWELLQDIKAGRAPYVIADAEVAPGLHWLMFRRADLAWPDGWPRAR